MFFMGEMYCKVLLIMAVLLAFMVPGFAMKKLKMVGEGGTLTLSNLLLYVCQPALAIKAFCIFTPEDWEIVNGVDKVTLLGNFAFAALISAVAMGLMFGLCKLVFFRAKDKNRANVYSFIAIFSNAGFLGVPFIEMFTDGDPLAVMYVMVFNVVFLVLCWTLGVVLITGNFKEVRWKKILLNPAILLAAVGLILFFVPQINIFMFEGLEEIQILPQYLSTMTAPLSMVIVGIRLAESGPRQLFCNGGIYLAGALRLIVAPFLTFGVALLCYFAVCGLRGGISASEEYMFLAPVIVMGMSPAASVVAMAERFGGDRDTATAAFVTNTLISIVTIPLIIMAIMTLWGLVL